jgi:hypothetical protein
MSKYKTKEAIMGSKTIKYYVKLIFLHLFNVTFCLLEFYLDYWYHIFSSPLELSMISSLNHPVLVSRNGKEKSFYFNYIFSGSTTDEYGHHKPVAFMAWRINGQYIMEGLAASFMFTLGGLGFILLDQTNKPNMPRLNRIVMILCSVIFILVAYFATKIFIR